MKTSDIITSNIDLRTISKEDLLETRIRELGLSLKDSGLESHISNLYQELADKNLRLRPSFYLSDEWGCLDGFPIISIPFYLVHPRLKQLEKEMMLEAEGGDPKSFMKLLRHETGHAYNYAYKLYKRRKWRELFGTFTSDYSTIYKPRPYSKKYVRHLDNWYAQCHPDEDFAETFAVWLTPESHWKDKYKNWHAYKKLCYIDNLMTEIAGKDPLVIKTPLEKPVHKIKSTLNHYYIKKRKENEHQYPQFFDMDLKEIFIHYKKQKGYQKASIFLRKHRMDLLNVISYWTAENKFTINQILKELIKRCNELNLGVDLSLQNQQFMNISTYLTTLIMNYYYTGTIAGD